MTGRRVANMATRTLAAGTLLLAPSAAVAGIESATFEPHTSFTQPTVWLVPGQWGTPKGWSGGEIAADTVLSIAAAAAGVGLALKTDRRMKRVFIGNGANSNTLQ